MKITLNLSYALIVLFVVSPLAQADVKINAAAGFDDNPHRLAEQFDPDASGFINLSLNYQEQLDTGLFVKLNLNRTSYNADNDANKTRWNFGAGYWHQFEDKDTLKFEFTNGDYDKTYVSRSTGEVGTSNNQPIGDRYDYSWSRALTEYNYRINKQHRITFKGEVYQKDYIDYSAFNLSNLDYQHLGFETKWRYRIAKNWFLYTGYRYRLRDYDGRVAKDTLGNDIADSNLEYTYHKLNVRARWRINKNNRINLQIFNEDKQDNFEGYYDTTYAGYDLSWRWKSDDDLMFNTRIRYLDYQSQNDIPESESEEEFNTSDNDGFVFSFTYQQTMWELKERSVNLFARAYVYDFEAVNPIYAYQRNLIEVGVKVEI